MICIDAPQEWPASYRGHSARWCHMWSWENDVEELKAFALRIGLKLRWFQPGSYNNFPHFDLTGGKIKAAVDAGAVRRSLREWVVQRRGLA